MTTRNNIRPILFSTEMVQAILAGRKTQTRRYLNPQPIGDLSNYELKIKSFNGKTAFAMCLKSGIEDYPYNGWFMPKYEIDDILWVRETYGITAIGNMYKANVCDPKYDKPKDGWKPSIYMPKEACRIFLKVTNVRCERLQDISQNDAISEGIEIIGTEDEFIFYKNYQDKKEYHQRPDYSFCSLWDSINAKKHPWESNPWVWVYDFERIEKPENFAS